MLRRRVSLAMKSLEKNKKNYMLPLRLAVKLRNDSFFLGWKLKGEKN